MKKTLLALAVAAASVSTAASAATIYKDDTSTLNMGGRVEVRANFADSNEYVKDQKIADVHFDDQDNKFSDASRVRINLEGIQKFNEDISFYGFTEYELSGDTDLDTRYLFAGVQSNTYGDLYYGHQDTAFTYLTNWTDMAETFSGYINESNAATADRADNVLRYVYNTDKLTVQAHIQGNSTSDGNQTTYKTNGYAVIAAYKLTQNLELGAGYASAEGYDASSVNFSGYDQEENNTYTAAVKYTTDNGLWLAATYEGGKVLDQDFNAADAYAGYTFGDNNVNLTYNYYDVDDSVAGKALRELNTNNVAVEYAHYFGEHATVYGSYMFNMLDDSDAIFESQVDNQAQVGFRYAF